MFCTTGHLTEYHPLDCLTAASSHLPRYEEHYAARMPGFEDQGRRLLPTLSHPDCQTCSDSAFTISQIAITVSIPGSMAHILQNPVSISGHAVCPCITTRPL